MGIYFFNSAVLCLGCGTRDLPGSMWDLSSLTRDRTQGPAWSVNHWTTGEVPEKGISELGPKGCIGVSIQKLY